MAEYRLRPIERLKKRGEFDAAFEQGRRFRGRLVTLVATPNGLAHGRVGVIASRRVGGAVRRNRAKRLMREAFRLNKHLLAAPLDLVMIAAPRLPDTSRAELEVEVQRLFERVNETVADQ